MRIKGSIECVSMQASIHAALLAPIAGGTVLLIPADWLSFTGMVMQLQAFVVSVVSFHHSQISAPTCGLNPLPGTVHRSASRYAVCSTLMGQPIMTNFGHPGPLGSLAAPPSTDRFNLRP
jgi:hypothetical protein